MIGTKVYVFVSFVSAVPARIEKFTPRVVNVSSPVTRGPSKVECWSYGVPTPETFWKKGSEVVGNSSYSLGVYQNNTCDSIATLHIENALSSDGGIYTCMASNSIGKAAVTQEDSKEIFLTGEISLST